MKWDLPISVEIDGTTHKIRNECDYRVILDAVCALNDDVLTDEEKIKCALFIFYEDLENIKDLETAIKEMFRVINYGEEQSEDEAEKPRLMDWEHDFQNIAPPVSRVLGYDVRTPNKYTHWWTFIGGYMEIGETTFSNVVSIRSKMAKGKKLEQYEKEFYRENKKMIDLPKKHTAEEEEWLNSDW